MEKVTATDLADQVTEAKHLLVTLGRMVFRISSDLSTLDDDQRAQVRMLVGQHALYENPDVMHAQMAEFYKASLGYVELLKDINTLMFELAGRGPK